MKSRGGLGAKRLNAISDEIVRRSIEYRDLLVEMYTADGFPPGAQPATPYQEYVKLRAMAANQDPAFMGSPKAAARLQELTYQFGAPGEMTGQPLAAPIAINPQGLQRSLSVGTDAPIQGR